MEPDSYMLDVFEGALPPPVTPTQARAAALRTPKKSSTSVTQTVVSPVTAQDKTPPPTPGAAPQGLRQSSVQRAQSALPGQYEALEKAMAPQDYTQMQDYAKQRTRQGQHSLLLALAAQEAGKEFEPIGGMYLKQAMEARQPLKTSTGFISPEGQHVEDAQLAADQKVKQITAQIQRNEQILSSAATAEEKEQARQDNLELKRQQMEQTMELRRMTAAAAGATRASAGDARTWRAEDGLSKQYDAITKDLRAELDATRKVKQLAPTMINRRPNAIEQQSMIVLLNKFLDPGSVVREGEFDRVAQAQGYVQRAQNLMNRIANGELMSDTLISQIVSMADFYDTAARAQLQARGDAYWEKAARRGLDPTNVVVDPDYKPRGASAEQGPAPGQVRLRGAQPAAPAPAPAPEAPPPGKVRVKGTR
jgi:hypothetical protein